MVAGMARSYGGWVAGMARISKAALHWLSGGTCRGFQWYLNLVLSPHEAEAPKDP
jgi:hypothetical protein